MKPEDIFTGHNDQKQQEYEAEISRRYGDKELNESRRRWGSYSAERKRQIQAEGGAIYLDLAAAIPSGPASPQAQAGIQRWHQHLRNFYEPTPEILGSLGDLYNDDPEFAAFFARIHPDLARFMRQAIQVYLKA